MTTFRLDDLLEYDLFQLLVKSTTHEKFYFESIDKKTTILALGNAEEISFNQATKYLEKYPKHLIWSPMSFENTANSKFYSSYITFIKKEGETTAFINPNVKDQINDIFKEPIIDLPTIPAMEQITLDLFLYLNHVMIMGPIHIKFIIKNLQNKLFFLSLPKDYALWLIRKIS